MKKIIIGSVLMLSGILISIGIIIAAAVIMPSMTGWSGSKLWFAIFGEEQLNGQAVQSLFLGFPFILGILLSVAGFAILVIEYFKK
jgi:hypothetical protein